MSISDKIRFDAMSCKNENTRKTLLAIADALDKGYSLEECIYDLKKVLDASSDTLQAP
jgi:hypothetical protein